MAIIHKTHVLAIPFPLQGHINPIVQFSKRLVSRGVRVTLVTSATFGSKLQQTQTCSNLMNIETVPDSAIDEVEGLDFYEIFVRNFRASITNGLPEIIEKHESSGSPCKAILYDSLIPWVLDIAHEKGLRGAVFSTQPCFVCSVTYHKYKGSLEITAEEGGDDGVISLPALPVMGFKDLPSLVYDTGSYPSLLRLVLEQFSTFEKADWRLFNTFDKLEDEILEWMGYKYPLLTIGPTIPSIYIDKRIQDNYDYGLSFFKPDGDQSCTKWLDTKEDRSVIYISFGSIANLSQKQMEELAQGLIDTKCSFLWVVRDPEKSKLAPDFPPDNGLVVNWCHQLEVLSHRAVGCFVTHCGWNSTLEAVSLGVPMVAIPQWTDQMTNAKFIVDVWKIGIRANRDENEIVTREEVATRVEEVMRGESGDELRRNALKWKSSATEAVSEGGSSDKNVAQFVGELVNN